MEQMAYSVAEFAMALKVSQKTIRRGIASREIPIIRVGRVIRIPATALDAVFDRAC